MENEKLKPTVLRYPAAKYMMAKRAIGQAKSMCNMRIPLPYGSLWYMDFLISIARRTRRTAKMAAKAQPAVNYTRTTIKTVILSVFPFFCSCLFFN